MPDGSQKATELDVARAIRDGSTTSPQRFGNLLLINLRVTGTGAAYRTQHQEFCWRDPSLYLNAEFLERCQGLPVVWEHPVGNVLTSDEFNNRIVGTVFLPFIQADEVWAICRIYDADAATALETERLSTSPAVIFRGADGSRVEAPDGSVMLIEGKPFLLDSLAICPLGVWDKGGPAAGVENSHLNFGDSDSMASTYADIQRQIDDLKRQLGPAGDRSEFVAAQVRADGVYKLLGTEAPSPLAGERIGQYRARLVNGVKEHSPRWRGVTIDGISSTAMGNIEDDVFADAVNAAAVPGNFRPGEMRAITTNDPSGRPITRYVGHQDSCWAQFSPAVRYVKRFCTPGRAA